MDKVNKSFALAVIFIFLGASFLIQQNCTVHAENSDITSKLTVINPNNSTSYKKSMPLNFTIAWSLNSPIPWWGGEISYSIDDSPKIDLNEGILTIQNNTAVATTYGNDLLNITNLTGGKHTLTIFAEGNYNLDDDFIKPYTFSFSPIKFFSQ